MLLFVYLNIILTKNDHKRLFRNINHLKEGGALKRDRGPFINSGYYLV